MIFLLFYLTVYFNIFPSIAQSLKSGHGLKFKNSNPTGKCPLDLSGFMPFLQYILCKKVVTNYVF